MNVSWQLHQRLDHAWGSLLPNGTFTGMISSIVKGDADIATASLNVTPERAKVASHIVSSSRRNFLAFPPT